MTNNDELALNLKSAADKAGAEEWKVKRNGPGEYGVMVKGSLVKYSGWSTHRPVTDEVVDKKTADFIATASPANILALLKERDADKKRIVELEALTADQDKRLLSYAAIATKNAEARTVSVNSAVGCDACGGNGSVAIDHGELGVEHMVCPKCAAAGIKLEVGE